MRYYCINLPARRDRYVHCAAIFAQLKLDVQFYHPEPDTDPTRGCYESHRHLAQITPSEEGYVVFEDDLVLAPGTIAEKLAQVIKLAHKHANQWAIFYLGCMPDMNYTRYEYLGSRLYRGGVYCTHAYLISPAAAARLRARPYNTDSRAIDIYFKQEECSVAYLPSLFYQGAFGSDIIPSTLKYNSWLLNPYSKFCNFYPTVVPIPLFYLLLLIIALLLLCGLVYLQQRPVSGSP